LKLIINKLWQYSATFCHGYNTNPCESCNAVAAHFSPKHTEFWAHYEDRMNYTTLLWNNTPNLQDLHSRLRLELGLCDLPSFVKERLISADNRKQNDKERSKSKEKKKRDHQLELRKQHLRNEEVLNSAAKAKKRKLDSIEYTKQGPMEAVKVSVGVGRGIGVDNINVSEGVVGSKENAGVGSVEENVGAGSDSNEIIGAGTKRKRVHVPKRKLYREYINLEKTSLL